MDNQHKLISGYRDLDQKDIDMINQIKIHEVKTLALIKEVENYLGERSIVSPEIKKFQTDAGCFRWLALARTNLEQGFMCFVRAVAQPQPAKIEIISSTEAKTPE